MAVEFQCKFEEYGGNMAEQFKQVLKNGDYSDVSVVCGDDNKQFNLHH